MRKKHATRDQTMKKTTNKHVARAVELAGGQTALARRCNKTQAAVFYWLHAEQVSAEAALLIERATDGKVNRFELRPDLFSSAPVPLKCSNFDEFWA